jgi:hypothetical protein
MSAKIGVEPYSAEDGKISALGDSGRTSPALGLSLKRHGTVYRDHVIEKHHVEQSVGKHLYFILIFASHMMMREREMSWL